MSTGAAELLQDTGGTITDEGATKTGEIAARSPLALFWRRLRRDKVALLALAVIVLLIIVAIFAGQIVKLFGAHPPNAQNSDALDSFGSAAAPGHGYIMGTDALGRDVFSRTIYGARISLATAFLATGLIVMIGVTLGMIAGYYRGFVDTALSRSMDVVLAFPVLLLALGLGAACSLKGCLTADSVGRDLFIFARRHPVHPGHRRGHIAAARAPRLPRPHGQRLGRCAWRRASCFSWPPSSSRSSSRRTRR